MTNVTLQEMKTRSEFYLSSSDTFTVYMQCNNGVSIDGNGCPMLSQKSGTVVPVRAFLALPDNISDKHSNIKIIDRMLYTRKDKNTDRFQKNNYAIDKKGSVDFIILQKDIDGILKTWPNS